MMTERGGGVRLLIADDVFTVCIPSPTFKKKIYPHVCLYVHKIMFKIYDYVTKCFHISCPSYTIYLLVELT